MPGYVYTYPIVTAPNPVPAGVDKVDNPGTWKRRNIPATLVVQGTLAGTSATTIKGTLSGASSITPLNVSWDRQQFIDMLAQGYYFLPQPGMYAYTEIKLDFYNAGGLLLNTQTINIVAE